MPAGLNTISATYISSTQYSLADNQTSIQEQYRPVLMLKDDDSVVRGYVVSSSFGGGITTVTISGASVPATLSGIAVGDISIPGNDSALPKEYLDTQYLNRTNTDTYTPSADYHPATKKYVDDNAGSGETNTMTNLGAGEGIYYQKSGVEFEMKSLVAGDNISLTSDNDTITISGSAGGVTDHGVLTGLLDDDHTQYLLRSDFTTSSGDIVDQIPTDYYTQAQVDGKWATWSGTIDHNTILNTHNLTTDIDHNQLTNYTINEHRTINDSGSAATDLWSAEKIGNEITSATGSLTVNHSELNELDYASSGHTGFAPTSHAHDKIEEGDSFVEVVDTGFDASVRVELDGSEEFRFMDNSGYGVILVGKTTSSYYGLDALGDVHLYSIGGSHVPAIYLDGGNKVLQYKDTYHNLAIGPSTGFVDEAYNNIFIGRYAGQNLTAGAYSNVAIGVSSLQSITTGDWNIAVGGDAGKDVTTGANNVLIGHKAGENQTTAEGCVKIGYDAGSDSDVSNRLFIENSNSASPLIYGEFDNDLVKINGTLQLGGDLDLNEHYIELKPSPSSDQTGSGDIASMTVDVNATGIGAALYMAADGNLEEADADASSTMPCIALALETGTGSKKVLLKGFMRNDSWNWTSLGQPVYVSTTAGALTQTKPSGSGDQVQIVGIATHADRIFFNPNYAIAEV